MSDKINDKRKQAKRENIVLEVHPMKHRLVTEFFAYRKTSKENKK